MPTFMFNKHIFIPTFGTKIHIFFIYRYCLWLKNEIIRLDLVTSSEVERSHEISPSIVIPSVVEGSLENLLRPLDYARGDKKGPSSPILSQIG